MASFRSRGRYMPGNGRAFPGSAWAYAAAPRATIRVLPDPRIALGRLGISLEVRALTALRTDRRPVGRPLVVGDGMTAAAVAEPGSRVDLAVFTHPHGR
jgi:hypothetical protein